MTEALLQTHGLRKAFDGVVAVDGVDLTVQAGALHALIGPNGAGKSTLLNLLAGTLESTAGSIQFHGQDITGLKPHQCARLGIGRSFQRTNVLARLTCLENCWLGRARKAARRCVFSARPIATKPWWTKPKTPLRSWACKPTPTRKPTP